ncbi:MAG: hypothetical protein KDN18_22255 [Verrucomicrobiae bacterium]|nr:hypothetical protein [Verrucomicrobiae bacterium]
MKILGIILMFVATVAVWGQDKAPIAERAKVGTTVFPEVPLPPQRTSEEFKVPLYCTFESVDELKDWAYNTARFGGWVETIKFSSREVYYSVRTFTSSTSTCEIIFFAEDHRGKIAPFVAIPLKHHDLSVKVAGNQVIVEAIIDSVLTPIMSFSDAILPSLPEEPKAQQNAAGQPAKRPESK